MPVIIKKSVDKFHTLFIWKVTWWWKVDKLREMVWKSYLTRFGWRKKNIDNCWTQAIIQNKDQKKGGENIFFLRNSIIIYWRHDINNLVHLKDIYWQKTIIKWSISYIN